MEIDVGGHCYPVSRSGPGYAFLREPASLPAGNAVLAMTIDGAKYLWNVDLKYETAPIDGRVEFEIKSGPIPQQGELRQMSFSFDWIDATD